MRTTHVPDVIRNGEASATGDVAAEQSIRLEISLPLRNEDALDTLLQQIYDPSSPNFHHYLTPEQFTDSFAPSQQDYNAVVAWVQAKGLQVTGTTPNRRLVRVEGQTGAINQAFHVLLKTYRDNRTARSFHAPDREPTVDLPVQLLAVSGLDDATPPHAHYKKGDRLIQGSSTTTEAAGVVEHIAGSGPSNTYLPSDMRAAYYGSGPLDGTGQTVAVFSFDDYLPADLNIFYTRTGMTSTVPVTNVYVDGYNTPCFGFNSNGTINYATCDDGEQILDIVNVIGMAPGLSGVLFYEGNSATAILNQIAFDNKASVITSSWGGGDFGSASDPAFKEFQAQGQTYLNATGDDGQFNSSTYDPPSVDPNITQVGGTDLVTTGAAGPWASETGWSDSGGGFMTTTAIPSYQLLAGVITASNKGSTTYRNAPDVAAEANFDNTTVINGKFSSGYGGTSFATPRWAGYIALANQQSVANGNGTLGFLNPTLYSIGVGPNYAANFHDITSGINKPLGGSGTGFSAVAGYDLITGWGSPKPALIATLSGASAADYSLSPSPASVSAVQGASANSTITVNGVNSFSGSVALTASGLPSGVTASFSPSSTTGSSVLTLTASSTAAIGSATVTITGTSGALTHTTAITLTITSPADYSLSASPTGVTAVQGAGGATTITVHAINDFTGAVALTASGLPAGVTAAFSPSSTTSSSILTLTASSIATLGSATVTITGTSGSLTHTTTVTLTVVPAADYSLSASPTGVSAVQGASGTSAITVNGINSFGGSVALTASGLPSGVTASFSPSTTTSGSTLTLTASSTATTGPATVTITGTSGTLTHTAIVSLTVIPAPDYSLSASAASVPRGASGTSSITVNALNNFTGSVALTASGLPSGVTASFSPAKATTSSTLTLTASSTAATGPATVTVIGTSGTLTHTATVTLTVVPAPDYSLAASPARVLQGASGTSSITVNALNNFTGSVALTASGLPAGVTASFSPSSTTSDSTLTLTASSTATAGPATVTITGTSGSLTRTTTLALTVLVPDYSLSAPSGGVTIPRGGSGSGMIAVTGLNGFSGAVNLTVSGLPSFVSASFSSATTTTASMLTFTALSYAAMASGTVTVTGVSNGLVHSTTLALTVTPAPDYSLSLAPASFSVPQGGDQSSTVTIGSLYTFNGAVTLSVTGLPAGVTASFAPPTATGSSILTLTASSTATVGSQTITVTGTSGTLSHSMYVHLVVTATPDYSLSVSSDTVSLVQAGSGTGTVSVTNISGFNHAVSLSASGLPSGVTASFSPSSTTSTSTLTLTASSAAALGAATVTITGTSGALVHTTTLNVNVASSADYALAVSPNPITVAQGNNGATTITVNGMNNFNGSVALSASGLPAGVTAAFSPASTTSSSTLTLTASSTATLSWATVTVTGTSGSLTHTATVTLNVVPAPDYSLSASSTAVSAVQGASGTTTITVNGINNFTGSVALAASGLPSGVTASFSPSSTTGSSTLTLTASSTATTGPAAITITGTSGSLTHTATVTLTVTPGPDYSLSSSSSSISTVQGASGTSPITVNELNSFSGSVNLAASGLPSGVTASFSPANTTTSSTLTLTASSTAAVGSATVIITGTSGSLIHTATVSLTVVPAPDYSLTASAASVVQGASATSSVAVNALNNFTDSVNLAASGLPAGVTASFSPSSTTSGSTLTLTASSTATVGQATITITGTSGSLVHTATVSLTVLSASDYSLSASPATVVQGGSGGTIVVVNALNNFSGSVALTASGLPAGVTASFSPSSTTSGSTLTLMASSTATPGPATITITGTSGNLIRSTSVPLTVLVPDYSLSSSGSVTIPRGGSGSSAIAITGLNGFRGAVNLTVSGLPIWVSASFSPATTTTASTLTFSALSYAVAGSATITITGVSNGLVRTTTLALTVTPPPDYSLSIDPGSLSVSQGDSQSATVTISGLYTFNGAVALSVTGLPAGVTAAFAPPTATSSSTLTLTASSTARVGSQTITITGTSGTLSRSIYIHFGVTPQN